MPEYPYTEPKQTLQGGRQSICPKCFHYKVCRGTANQPCIECNQFLLAAGVRPVVHGEWGKSLNPSFSPFDDSGAYRYRCNQCRHIQNYKSNFCPCCGAAMDEEDET